VRHITNTTILAHFLRITPFEQLEPDNTHSLYSSSSQQMLTPTSSIHFASFSLMILFVTFFESDTHNLITFDILWFSRKITFANISFLLSDVNFDLVILTYSLQIVIFRQILVDLLSKLSCAMFYNQTRLYSMWLWYQLIFLY
jgi:hypothetical protein